ncbi:MAG: hypothetical protein EZS28_030876 [Streblomastix strix]|uniref:Uncharacterized protein n=1 Tax=Streblomastix strix TaxID=222440 RepID=A0A5J4UT99_9EUKA|nr:MAG: hypothetical protein EZS28_030876 [Streblomastix strix]
MSWSGDYKLRNPNHEIISKILLTITGPKGGGSRRILSPMDHRNDADSSSSGINPQSNQQSQTRWCNRTSDLAKLDLEEVYSELPYNNCSIQSDINIGDLGSRQENKRFKVKTSTKTANRRNDKHSRGEQICRDVAIQSGFKEESIQDMIAKMNQESWRKRRAGLDELADYAQSQKTNLDSLIGNKADIKLVNALVWVFNKGGGKLQQRVKKLREYGCTTLSQFSEMKEISKSRLSNQFSKKHQLAKQSKAKFNTMWNIQFHFNYMEKRRFKSVQEKQSKAMSLIVAFSATRMVELALDALRIWVNERRGMQNEKQELWWNFAKVRPATSDVVAMSCLIQQGKLEFPNLIQAHLSVMP